MYKLGKSLQTTLHNQPKGGHVMESEMNLNAFLDKFDQLLYEMGYAPTTLNHYGIPCRQFREYCEERSITAFSEKLAHRFLKEHYGVTVYTRENLTSTKKNAIRAVNALNDFYQYGKYKRVYLRKKPVVLTEHYQKMLDEFREYSLSRNRSKAIIYRNTNMLRAFFVYLEGIGIGACNKITPQIIHGFMDSLKQFCTRTVATNNSMLKLFFHFLADKGYSDTDLTECLPHIRCYRASLIPSVWKKEDVEKLIGAIDRGNPCGKRDLAILLLVIQMGLRASDIRNLKLSNLKWSGNHSSSTVELTQSKTGEILSLPMPPDVAVALVDYLKNGRPKSEASHVFLRHNAPHNPFAANNGLNNIIFRLAGRAGIKFTCETKHGMHSLRHTFATNLITNGVSLKIASELLGHRSTLSTDVYIKTDISMLRTCALNPAEVIPG